MKHCRKCKLELDGGDTYCHACDFENTPKQGPVSLAPSFTEKELDNAAGRRPSKRGLAWRLSKCK